MRKDIPFTELPKKTTFIGKPIKEHGVDVERPLSRFVVSSDGFLHIYARDNSAEIYIGGVGSHGRAHMQGDGSLCIHGTHAPTFILYMEDIRQPTSCVVNEVPYAEWVEATARGRGEPVVAREHIIEALRRAERGQEAVEWYPLSGPSLKGIYNIAVRLEAATKPKS